MKFRHLIQFRLRTAQSAMLALGVVLGVLPHWTGPYDRIIDSVMYRASGQRSKWAGTNQLGGHRGNERTREFLRWSATLHFDFCGGQLDSNGDFVTLCLYPCW